MHELYAHLGGRFAVIFKGVMHTLYAPLFVFKW